MRKNVITQNNSFGIGIVENPFGFGAPDDNVVTGNTVLQNGANIDPRTGGLGGDIVYDGQGSGDCFACNVYKTDAPPGIVSAFPCT